MYTDGRKSDMTTLNSAAKHTVHHYRRSRSFSGTEHEPIASHLEISIIYLQLLASPVGPLVTNDLEASTSLRSTQDENPK